ncbi:MAG TPA: tetratricopeptide repeat protein [Bryobacteraceae bacterium]|nr:tetratricopeptide repeat protein [Bryobacteraceae bacterium]
MRLPLRIALAAGAAAISLFADDTAVLPFANVSSSSLRNVDWIGESIAEDLRATFSARGILTLERDRIAEAYRRLQLRERSELTEGSILKLGEVLDAEHVVHGTFLYTPAAAVTPGSTRASKGSLKIQARVSDRRRLRQSAVFEESGALEDLATLEAHLAWRALTAVAPAQAPAESEFRSLRTPVPLDALENYIRGLLAAAPEQKEKYFAQAARLNPDFSPPAFELGKIHFERKDYREAAQWLEHVGPADNHYREASFLLGIARYQAGDFEAANKAFQMISAKVPISVVWNNLGAAESRQNLPQSIDSFRKALDQDPSDPDYHFNLGYALFKKGDFAAAADRFREVLDRAPGDQMATLLLGRCLKKQGLRAATPSDARLQALERLKYTYEERVYFQLKSILESRP